MRFIASAIGAVLTTSSIAGAQARCEPAWSDVGSTPWYKVHALAVFDDGSGPALYVGGLFETIGGVAANNIAKWDGATWSPLGKRYRHSSRVGCCPR